MLRWMLKSRIMDASHDMRKSSLLQFFLIVTGLGGLSQTLHAMTPGGEAALIGIGLIVTLACACALSLPLSRRLQDRACRIVTLSYGVISMVYLYVMQAGNASFAWTNFFPLIAFFLLGAKKGAIAFLAYGGAILLMLSLHYWQWPSLHAHETLHNIVGSLLTFGATAWYLEHSRKRILTKTQEAAHTDPLTGLANRRFFLKRFEEMKQAASASSRSAFLLCDIDHFKGINDTHGHATGDAVIVAVARRIEACTRAEDTVGRVGGEEFAALLTGCDRPEAIRRAEEIRQKIAAAPVGAGGATIATSISIGVAFIASPDATFNDVYTKADNRLYMAKTSGRNRVSYRDASASLVPSACEA